MSVPKNRKIRKAWSSPYVNPGDHDGRDELRGMFFDAIHAAERRVTHELMKNVLDLYRPIYLDMSSRRDPNYMYHGTPKAIPSWPTLKYPVADHDPVEFTLIRGALLKWADKWGFVDDWIMEAALDTLSDMAEEERPLNRPLNHPTGSMVLLPFSWEESRFTFSDPGWIPTLHPWEWTADSIREAFEEELSRYRKRMECLAREKGLVPNPFPSRKRAGDPMERVVRRIAFNETDAEIAVSLGISEKAVRESGHKLARLMGLTMPDLRKK